MHRIRAVIFDAYGTLLDVHAAMAKHADRLGPNWRQISADWRAKQVEYAWVRSLVGPSQHRDFWRLTQEALEVVTEQHGIADAALKADILAAYRKLDAYPEVPEMLQALKTRGTHCAILSNGEPDMLHEAVVAAGIDKLLDAVLSVESVRVFKPDPRVYRLAARRFHLAPREMGFVSSNPWDAFGAYELGFRAIRVNRTGAPDEYGLRGHVPELKSLAELSALLA
ncbi:MAG TPA: haloacid dehalogenase type II [Acetobacteraceae bacterium]|jgi:2-haloacid dehalogenase|nr:haloacid dehalogenase type II [Acetobacteraceae bacterium]